MQRVDFKVENREERGDSSTRKLREDGYIPGVVYGRGMDTVHIKVMAGEFRNILRSYGQNCIFRLQFADKKDDEIIAIVKDMQLDYLSERILHLDFLKISLDEPITVEIPIVPVGTSAGELSGGSLDQEMFSIEIEALPLDVPDEILVDVTELDFGDTINVSNLELPADVNFTTDPGQVVFTIATPEVIEIEEEEEEVVEELEEGEEIVDEEEIEEDSEDEVEE
jgi:large subunit ribosomal protein L25